MESTMPKVDGDLRAPFAVERFYKERRGKVAQASSLLYDKNADRSDSLPQIALVDPNLPNPM